MEGTLERVLEIERVSVGYLRWEIPENSVKGDGAMRAAIATTVVSPTLMP